MVQLSLEGGRGDDREMERLEVPTSYLTGWPDDPVIGNVARIYARIAADLRDGTRTAPTFDDAVKLHRLVDAIETAADEGQRVSPQLC
jgi:predicted dehydrogenase